MGSPGNFPVFKSHIHAYQPQPALCTARLGPTAKGCDDCTSSCHIWKQKSIKRMHAGSGLDFGE